VNGTVYRFSHCEVDTGARELRVAGRVQALEPRPFDLLVLLLRHRERDVTTEELLDRLWHGEFVAPGSVANAVAKVRRAIGDDGASPLIRTVHRVGYRFAGDVAEALPAAPPPGAPRGGPAPLPLALLPFENLTGNPALDWMALGLMSLVCHALAQEERLAPLPVPVVAAALQRCPPQADAQQCAQAVRLITGARHVVHTRIHRGGTGYRLDYRLLAPEGEAQGTLAAGDPVALGRLLARRLLEQLSPGGVPPAHEPAHDPWAMEVLARALAAVAARQWARAAQLLTVVVDLEPGHGTARLELLQARAMVHEGHGRFGAALDLWREAAERATAAGVSPMAVRANGRAALAAAMCGLRDEALRRVEHGLAQAQARGAHDDLCRRAAQLCQVHTMVGEPLPRLALGEAGAPNALAEDARAAWWAVRGHLLAHRGNPAGAARCFSVAVALYRAAGAAGREGALLMWWLHALLRSERVAEAEKVLRRAEACSGGHGFLLRGLPWCRARVRDAQGDRAGALAALAPAITGPALDLGHAAACALAARWLLEDGRADEARATLALVNPALAGYPLVSAMAASLAQPSPPL
jgi:DNA-binding winged helix-turn-helix (wHTH) protein/tetratricopeptide (TPR) repeat protein